jgi:hypothetical protein
MIQHNPAAVKVSHRVCRPPDPLSWVPNGFQSLTELADTASRLWPDFQAGIDTYTNHHQDVNAVSADAIIRGSILLTVDLLGDTSPRLQVTLDI